jgi:hypothetical protein
VAVKVKIREQIELIIIKGVLGKKLWNKTALINSKKEKKK